MVKIIIGFVVSLIILFIWTWYEIRRAPTVDDNGNVIENDNE